MITVYFENESPKHADIVAMFDTEALYEECLPALEAYAAKHRLIVTESVTEHDIGDVHEFAVKHTSDAIVTSINGVCTMCRGTGVMYLMDYSLGKKTNVPCRYCNSEKLQQDAAEAMVPAFYDMTKIINRAIELAKSRNLTPALIYLTEDEHKRLLDDFNKRFSNGFKYISIKGYEGLSVLITENPKSFIMTDSIVLGSYLVECFNLYTGEKL